MTDVRLFNADCRAILPTLPDASVDCVICDPPYPMIDRPYGKLTEAEWHGLMDVVVPECRRILKPKGSAVFILQPNSERVGRMRPWLFEFQAKWCREWGMVQDAYWWNINAMPTGGAGSKGMLRAGIKLCVWLGSQFCYRNQASVLWAESYDNLASRARGRCERVTSPSGWRPNSKPRETNHATMKGAAERRGGVTPFNVIPLPNSQHREGHGAATPLALADWWLRYICPPGGTVLDPFIGSGTVGIAAVKSGRSIVGIERMTGPGYFPTAQERIDAAMADRAGMLIPA